MIFKENKISCGIFQCPVGLGGKPVEAVMDVGQRWNWIDMFINVDGPLDGMSGSL